MSAGQSLTPYRPKKEAKKKANNELSAGKNPNMILTP
jgi:hypothetical protein